ncbi:MAG: tRNA (adenosine(37)-N6)-threonylcarbamoyltransferase complex ATPase subunit type 1 TsaE [Steroidobacter sp.]
MREPGTAILNVPTPEAMRALGEAIARAIDDAHAAFIVALEGELGAGKTTLVGGILRAYGVSGPVRSPTYTLIEPYEVADRRVYHLDLYRLTDPDEVEPLGIRDLLSEPCVLLIEWPSRAAGALPAFDLSIGIDYPSTGADGRQVTLRAHSSSGHNVVQRIVAAIPEMRLLSS